MNKIWEEDLEDERMTNEETRELVVTFRLEITTLQRQCK